jgi:hypothetical protein
MKIYLNKRVRQIKKISENLVNKSINAVKGGINSIKVEGKQEEA